MRRLTAVALSSLLLVFLSSACGDDDGGSADGADSDGDGIPDVEDPDDDDDGIPDSTDTDDDGDGVLDGDEGTGAACSNGVDDDDDGLADGDDPECTGPADDREDSFATGIPGDNIDAIKQDCFFDGNSGHGDDKCEFHTCCLLEECPADLDDDFDRETDCQALTEDCIDYCAQLTPAGCDCFGCCTICDPETDECADILTNETVSPDCTLADLNDPELCPPCIKNEECGGGECEPDGCILCPGQTEEDLPDECNDMNECPGDITVCDTSDDCAADEYCASGCCIGTVD